MNQALIKKAKQAASPEELVALAKAEHIELGEKDAKRLFAEFHNEGELSDDELTAAAGGSCNTDWIEDDTHVALLGGMGCPTCGCHTATYITQRFTTKDNKQYFRCDACGVEYYLTSLSTVNGKAMERL